MGRLFVLFTLLALVRIPYFLTGHVQEDAYIAWHCARTLATTGIYGFNPAERVSAATTHLYVFSSALAYRLLGPSFLIPVLLVNTFALLTACYLLAAALMQDGRQARTLWVLAALTPISLQISYIGMETAFLVLAIALPIWAIANDRTRWAIYAPFFFLPWIRPDSLLTAALILTWDRHRNGWRPAAKSIAALLTGAATLLLFNTLYFGSPLNHSIVAKQVAFHPSHTLAEFLNWLPQIIFFVTGPLETKFLLAFWWLFLLLEAAFIGALLWNNRRAPRTVALLALLVALMTLPPLAYGAGGIGQPWYFWPSRWIGVCLLLKAALDYLDAHPRLCIPGQAALGVALFLAAAAQWSLALNVGYQEHRYRAGIGSYLRQTSDPADSIMLEPVGYIPWFAERYTHDEIGLASPRVTDYRRQYGTSWWLRYVRDFHPTWLIERPGLRKGHTLDNDLLNPSERQWLSSHYRLDKTFHYNPAEFTESPVLLRLLSLGTHTDYDLYRIRPESPVP